MFHPHPSPLTPLSTYHKTISKPKMTTPPPSNRDPAWTFAELKIHYDRLYKLTRLDEFIDDRQGEYIKQLKGEVSKKDELLQQKDIEMEALRKQLAELRRGSSAGFSSSDSSAENITEIVDEMKTESSSTPAAVDET